MRYNQGKIKSEHHSLKEFEKELRAISDIPFVHRIIPGRISRQQKGSSLKKISFSYFTDSGLKFNIKKGGTAQELFIICDEENKEEILKKVMELN